MNTWFGWAALAVLLAYLALFYWGTYRAAKAAGKRVWLIGQSGGHDRLAALGYRAAFSMALFGPLVWMTLPLLQRLDPLWTEGRFPVLGTLGITLAGSGALIAVVAQLSMGASWRVGVKEGATGDLVSGGIFKFSRNPTFVGQFLLLIGVALAIPSLPTAVAPLLFIRLASAQVRSEETALRAAIGSEYDAYMRSVPRWIGLPRKEAS